MAETVLRKCDKERRLKRERELHDLVFKNKGSVINLRLVSSGNVHFNSYRQYLQRSLNRNDGSIIKNALYVPEKSSLYTFTNTSCSIEAARKVKRDWLYEFN